MCFKLYFCFYGDQLSVCSDICIRDVEGEWLLFVSKTESFGWIHCFVFVVILSVLIRQRCALYNEQDFDTLTLSVSSVCIVLR